MNAKSETKSNITVLFAISSNLGKENPCAISSYITNNVIYDNIHNLRQYKVPRHNTDMILVYHPSLF